MHTNGGFCIHALYLRTTSEMIAVEICKTRASPLPFTRPKRGAVEAGCAVQGPPGALATGRAGERKLASRKVK